MTFGMEGKRSETVSAESFEELIEARRPARFAPRDQQS